MSKKLVSLIVAIMFTLSCSVVFAGISTSGGSKSSPPPSRPSVSTSKSGLSTSNQTKATSPSSSQYSSGGGISTTKTQQNNAMQKENNQNLKNISDNSSRYSGGGYGGHDSWGTAMVAGLAMGSLLHPWSVPMYGGAGYAAAPLSMSIIFIIFDLIIFGIVCFVLYKLFKRFRD